MAEKLDGKVAFFTAVDSQSTLTHGTSDQGAVECHTLGTRENRTQGLIFASNPYGTPKANERAVSSNTHAKPDEDRKPVVSDSPVDGKQPRNTSERMPG